MYRHVYQAEPKDPIQFGSVSGSEIYHFPIVVLYLSIGQNQKNPPNLVLYLVRRSKIFVSVATLLIINQECFLQFHGTRSIAAAVPRPTAAVAQPGLPRRLLRRVRRRSELQGDHDGGLALALDSGPVWLLQS